MRAIVRRVDELGRFVIPKGFREIYGINPHDEVKLYPDEGCFYIKKHDRYAKCAMTGESTDDIKAYGEGIFLSKAGREKLLEELKDDLDG